MCQFKPEMSCGVSRDQSFQGRFCPRPSVLMSRGFVSVQSGGLMARHRALRLASGCIGGGTLGRIISFTCNDASLFRSNSCHGPGRRHGSTLFPSEAWDFTLLRLQTLSCALVSFGRCAVALRFQSRRVDGRGRGSRLPLASLRLHQQHCQVRLQTKN